MKTFNTFDELSLARVLTGTPVRVLQPALVDGVVEATGEGLSLLSGNVFVPRFDDQEAVTGRKTSLLADEFTGNLSTYINLYRKDDTGTWVEGANGRTSNVFYNGQIWWVDTEATYVPGGYLVQSWSIPTANPDILEVRTSIGTILTFSRYLGLSRPVDDLVTPVIQDRQIADGITNAFAAPNQDTTADANFLVVVDGLVQAPGISFNSSPGQITFTEVPPLGAEIDITYYFPVTIDGIDGIIPQIAPRQTGDGTTVEFNTPANAIAQPTSFSVAFDGLQQRPVTDYSINNSGNIVFAEAPDVGVAIDVTFFNPSAVELNPQTDLSFNPVVATGSTATRDLGARFAETINVRDFGAVGDGVVDDTSAFTAALTRVSEQQKLYVPAGRYLIASSIIIPTNKKNIFIQGDDKATTLISSSGSFSMLHLNGSSSDFLSGITIEGIRFQGTSSHHAIQTNNTTYTTIRNCIFAGCSSGIHMSETGGQSDVRPSIVNNVFSRCINGLWGGQTRVADATISHNIFVNNRDNNIYFGYLDGGDITYNKIFTDRPPVFTGENNGIVLTVPIWVKIIGNDIFECNGYGLRLGTPRHCSVSENTLVNIGSTANKSAISVYEYDPAAAKRPCEFTYNKIVDANGTAIEVVTEDNFDFCYNQLLGTNKSNSGTGDSFRFISSTGNKLEGNRIEGSTQARYWLYLDGSEAEILHNKVNGHTDEGVYRQNGGIIRDFNMSNVVSGITTTYTVPEDVDSVLGGSLPASIYMNIPSATGVPGKRITFTKTDSSAFSLILDPAATQTIDGVTTMNVNTQYQTIQIISDGSNWFTV